MKVIRADKAGFCFGVKRALDLTEKSAATKEVATLGPLIHNRQVVERLAERGVQDVPTLDHAGAKTLIIRSHGVPPQVYREAAARDIDLIDATCPFVRKAQKLAAKAAESRQVIVVGDREHPEVQGILGWAGGQALAIETLEEARALTQYPSLAVLAQTTQPAANFQLIVEELRRHTEDLTVYHTICNATQERQEAARELSAKVDVMVVVGGKNSANTRKLVGICADQVPTYLVETASELEEIWFVGAKTAGLTAGASTPDWIIEEVYRKMSDMNEKEPVTQAAEESNQDSMNMESWDQGLQELHRGAVVTGTVVKMTDDEVFVDIGWKSEGVITRRELAVANVEKPEDVVAVGDQISAVVLKVENEEGYPVLSKRRADEAGAVDHLAELAESNEEIQAKVIEVVKGGLLVNVGMRGFVPASQIQFGFVEDLNQFLGQTLRLRVIEFDPARKKVVLSQKAILAEEQQSKRKQLMESLQEGDIVKGVVRRLTNFGAFVDIGGVDGLLHVSDMAYSRVKHPSELLKVGDEVEVQVLKVDREHEKIGLGLKQLKASPWSEAADKYPVGSLVSGKVVRIAPFGAFVQLEDGVDALVHISQLADRRVGKVEEVVQVGDMVSAKVIECKPEEKRISLSIREAAAEAKAAIAQEELAAQPEIPEVTIGEAVGIPNGEDDHGKNTDNDNSDNG